MLCAKYRDFLRWNIYQIYPRSFMDANGDGIGDLRGILSRLDYLKDLGINAIWLCPCYLSPNDDNGYDISDYREIMPEVGTMEDMDCLIAALHERDMKLILDLVTNHTSTQHAWFQTSRQGRDNPYSDFYYWSDTVPNTWQSVFRGSAWAFDDVRGQYYLHSFALTQADLNWENPAVVRAMQDIVDFWVDKGVDGFRIDVIDMISKDMAAGKNGLGPRLHEYIRALFGREKTAHLFTVGESGVQDLEEMLRHCAAERNELSTLFLFDHLDVGRKDKFTPKPDTLLSLRDRLLRWQRESEANDVLHALFTDNHDNSPLLSRIADDGEKRYESATLLAAMVYLLKGVPFIYQGQEIGMTAAHYDSISDFDDIETHNAYREFCAEMTPEEALEKINFGSRDNARHPMAWDGSATAGFTSGTPWLALHSRFRDINVQADLASEKSVYRFYQALLSLRASSPAFLDGTLTVLSRPEDPFFVFTRSAEDTCYAVVCNFEEPREITLPFPCACPVLSNHKRTTLHGLYPAYGCAVARVHA